MNCLYFVIPVATCNKYIQSVKFIKPSWHGDKLIVKALKENDKSVTMVHPLTEFIKTPRRRSERKIIRKCFTFCANNLVQKVMVAFCEVSILMVT